MDAQTWTGKLYKLLFFFVLSTEGPWAGYVREDVPAPHPQLRGLHGATTRSLLHQCLPVMRYLSFLLENKTLRVSLQLHVFQDLYCIMLTVLQWFHELDCIDRAVNFIHQTLNISRISEYAKFLTKVEENLSNKGWKALMAWQSLVIGTDAVFRLFIFVLHLLWRVF